MKKSVTISNYKDSYKDIYCIRRDNLILLSERYTSYSELKNILGISSSYLSELVSKDLKKKISDHVARNIESAAELPHGWLDNDHTSKKNDLKRIPVVDIESLSLTPPIPYKFITISISNEYICDFCVEIGSHLENPLLPNGTIALFKNVTDFRFLRNGDIIILEKENRTYLSYFKNELRHKYLVNLSDLSKTELIDSKVNLKAKMIYAIMKQIPDSCLNF